MMKMSGIKPLVRLTAVALMLAYAGFAQAYSCLNTSLTSNDGCIQGSAILDTPGNIAADDPFGIDNWVLLDTSNDGTDDAIANFTIVTTGTNSGVWSLTFAAGSLDPWNTYDDLMITLNGGLGNYVAYSLVPTNVSGNYTISGVSDLNHARLWGSIAAVPVPAALWLFGSGLVGLAAIARRRA